MFWKKLKLPKFSLPRITWRPSREALKKATWFGVLVASLFGAFCWGRYGDSSLVHGQTPQAGIDPALLQQASNADRARHVVAYIYGNIPITREELGDYLVDRCGAERLDFLVNRRIIERSCDAMNIHITDAEIKAQLAEDLRAFNCTESDFVNKVLRKYNKTLFEWKEDVIRPKLALQRFVKDKVVGAISEQDVQKAFEAQFGPKVECRIIVVTKEEVTLKKEYDIWTKAKENFEKAAKEQTVPQFAAEGGKIPAIHTHFPDSNIEEAAFKLQKGEISPLIRMPDGTMVILNCVERKEADSTKTLSEERPRLYRQVFEARVTQEIPTVFNSMRQAANPQLFLRREFIPQDQPAIATQGVQLPQ